MGSNGRFKLEDRQRAIAVDRRRFVKGALAATGAGALVLRGGIGAALAQGGTPATTASYKPLHTYPSGTSIGVLVSASHQQFTPLWNALDTFKQLTGITVNLSKTPTSDLRPKIMQSLQLGGEVFDNIEFPDDTFVPAQKYMAPLEPFLQAQGTDVEAWKGQFVSWSIQSVTQNGQIKYYPYYSGANAIAYREDLLTNPQEQQAFKQKFGYDLPVPPETFDQLVDLAKHFTRDKLWGLVFPGTGETGQNVMESLIFLSGVTYVDEQNHSLWGPKHPENQPVVAAAAKKVQDFIYELKVTPQQVTGMTTNEATAFYQSGQAAMLLDIIYLPWNELKQPNVVKVIGQSGSFQIPSLKQGAGTIPYYWSRGIPKAGKQKDAGWEFMRWVMDEGNLQLCLEKGQGVFVPTNTKVLDWAVSKNIVPSGVAEAVKGAQFYRMNPAIPQARQIVRKYYEQLTLKQITPEEFAKQSGNDIEQLMKQAGLVQ